MSDVIHAGTGVSPDPLNYQIAIVSGAGSNIGLAVARALACPGARVVIAELDAARVEEAEHLFGVTASS